MKKLIGTVSAIDGSSEIIGSSDCDWRVVRPGSTIKIGSDLVTFTIAKVQEKDFNYEFEVIDSDNISIEEKEENCLVFPGDVIFVHFKKNGELIKKEFEINRISTSGKRLVLSIRNHKIGDVERGDIWCRKWILFLTSKYRGKTQFNVPYELVRDFTMHLNLPLMSENTPNPEIHYNSVVKQIDQKYGLVLEEIEQIKKRIQQFGA